MPARKNPQQINGFYIHSSPPKVLQVHSSVIRQWLRAGDVGKLEQLVLDGQGHKLVGEYSPDPRVRNLLRQIPAFLVKTKKLQDAIAKGDLKKVQKLFTTSKSSESIMKNIHMSKSQGGLGLLHKAVYYGHPHIVDFLVSNFPQSVNQKDDEGKTPLHYCGASREAGKIWPMLAKAGADTDAVDYRGKRPSYYMERSNEISIPEDKISSGVSVASGGDKNNFLIKPSNIRIWIHDRDIRKLQRVVWEGHGAKLRVETSNHPRVKKFLDGVPYLLNLIKDTHASVVNNDYAEFVKKTSDPVPVEILRCKDLNGLTPLHKAAGLNRRKIAENIVSRNPNSVFLTDNEGKTPLHYAAALKDDGVMFDFLLDNHSDETTIDKAGKTASYYKSNPKEINGKLLEAVPEAPRTSVAFPQGFDWSLFQTDVSQQSNYSTSLTKIENENTLPLEDTIKASVEAGSKPEEVDEKSSISESENIAVEQTEESKDFDIWTNEDNEGEETVENARTSELDEEERVKPEEHEKDLEEQEEPEKELLKPEEPEEMQRKQELESEQEPTEPENEEKKDYELMEEPSTTPVPAYEESIAETKHKTEREIAEERQRLLDEGLIRINSVDSETDVENSKINEAIVSGDLEKLATMVLNGEGDKLRGKISNSPEIQSFLDNIPNYMNKITEVHKAARTGSLKDLQAALDRRKFAVAKDSTNKSGATPLHVAVAHGNTSIVQYLGGRFPETLTSKDNTGKTPLHYAATLNDDGSLYNMLVELGADENAEDDSGHSASHYRDNPGELTQDKLSLAPEPSREVSTPVTDPSIHNVEPEISFDEGIPFSKSGGNDDGDDDLESQSNFGLTDRDEYGQSVLHFAAARAHGRGGLFQLIQESGVNLGYKDELYRTARDIAQQANIPENINEIDKYVMSLAAKGETGKLVELFLEGYDHILDLEDDLDNDIATVASSRNHEKTLAFLKAIPALEEKREKVHRAARAGDWKQIEQIVAESKNSRFLMIGKNTAGRCSLHTAVLCQQQEVTEFIAQKFPETLRVGDNLERTPLHYAMGVEEVEKLSKILIQCGAKRVVKDLKGRQPTYYFMNKTEILKLQEEENMLRS